MKFISTLILALFSSLITYGQGDTQAPEMGLHSFSPASVDVSNNPANLAFNVTATDDVSGVASVSVTIELPNGSTESVLAVLNSGGALNGVWQASFIVPRITQAGPGILKQVFLLDNSGKTRIYSTDSGGFPNVPGSANTFNVINSNPPDTQDPALVSFVIDSTSVNVTTVSRTVKLKARLTDNNIGVRSVFAIITLPNMSTLFSIGTFLPAVGTSVTDGDWEMEFTVPVFTTPGTAILTILNAVDTAGNQITYPNMVSPLLSAFGTPSFTIINNNDDNIAPTLMPFVNSTTSVDVSASTQIFKITARLLDNISGVKTVSASIALPNGGPTLNSVGTFLPSMSSTTLDGLWDIEFTIPRFIAPGPGPAIITGFTLVDTTGNSRTYPNLASPLISAFGPSSFTVVNSNVDTVAPALNSFTITEPPGPLIYDITSASVNITVSALATDNFSGIKSALIAIRLPNGQVTAANATLAPGTNLSGTWNAVFTIPAGTLPGIGRIHFISLTDNADIMRSYGSMEASTLGPDFTVVNSNVMPVQWVRPITATIRNKHSIIEWSTASQINNDKFIIEHSKDGREFEYAGEQKGEGNSSEIKAYSYVHESPSSGMNYYRIKQMDFDGKYSYSNITSVTYKSRDLMIYPNPVKNEVIIISSEDHLMQILDVNGRLVISKSLHEGQNSISMFELQSGTYILMLQNGEQYKIIKE